jgi:hypothetical protein
MKRTYNQRRPLASLRFFPPLFFRAVFGDGCGESSWLSLKGGEMVEVSAVESSHAVEDALLLWSEAILFSRHVVVFKTGWCGLVMFVEPSAAFST